MNMHWSKSFTAVLYLLNAILAFHVAESASLCGEVVLYEYPHYRGRMAVFPEDCSSTSCMQGFEHGAGSMVLRSSSAPSYPDAVFSICELENYGNCDQYAISGIEEVSGPLRTSISSLRMHSCGSIYPQHVFTNGDLCAEADVYDDSSGTALLFTTTSLACDFGSCFPNSANDRMQSARIYPDLTLAPETTIVNPTLEWYHHSLFNALGGRWKGEGLYVGGSNSASGLKLYCGDNTYPADVCGLHVVARTNVGGYAVTEKSCSPGSCLPSTFLNSIITLDVSIVPGGEAFLGDWFNVSVHVDADPSVHSAFLSVTEVGTYDVQSLLSASGSSVSISCGHYDTSGIELQYVEGDVCHPHAVSTDPAGDCGGQCTAPYVGDGRSCQPPGGLEPDSWFIADKASSLYQSEHEYVPSFKFPQVIGCSGNCTLLQGFPLIMWTDLSPYGRHLYAANTSSVAIISADLMTGLPIIGFDGETVLFQSGFHIKNDVSMFVVFRVANMSSEHRVQILKSRDSGFFLAVGNAGGEPFMRMWIGSPGVMYNCRDSDVLSTVSSGEPTLVSIIRDDTDTVAMFVNGVLCAERFDVPWSPISLTVGLKLSSFELREILIYESAVAENSRKTIESYLHDKYDLATPSVHSRLAGVYGVLAYFRAADLSNVTSAQDWLSVIESNQTSGSVQGVSIVAPSDDDGNTTAMYAHFLEGTSNADFTLWTDQRSSISVLDTWTFGVVAYVPDNSSLSFEGSVGGLQWRYDLFGVSICNVTYQHPLRVHSSPSLFYVSMIEGSRIELYVGGIAHTHDIDGNVGNCTHSQLPQNVTAVSYGVSGALVSEVLLLDRGMFPRETMVADYLGSTHAFTFRSWNGESTQCPSMWAGFDESSTEFVCLTESYLPIDGVANVSLAFGNVSVPHLTASPRGAALYFDGSTTATVTNPSVGCVLWSGCVSGVGMKLMWDPTTAKDQPRKMHTLLARAELDPGFPMGIYGYTVGLDSVDGSVIITLGNGDWSTVRQWKSLTAPLNPRAWTFVYVRFVVPSSPDVPPMDISLNCVHLEWELTRNGTASWADSGAAFTIGNLPSDLSVFESHSCEGYPVPSPSGFVGMIDDIWIYPEAIDETMCSIAVNGMSSAMYPANPIWMYPSSVVKSPYDHISTLHLDVRFISQSGQYAPDGALPPESTAVVDLSMYRNHFVGNQYGVDNGKGVFAGESMGIASGMQNISTLKHLPSRYTGRNVPLSPESSRRYSSMFDERFHGVPHDVYPFELSDEETSPYGIDMLHGTLSVWIRAHGTCATASEEPLVYMSSNSIWAPLYLDDLVDTPTTGLYLRCSSSELLLPSRDNILMPICDYSPHIGTWTMLTVVANSKGPYLQVFLNDQMCHDSGYSLVRGQMFVGFYAFGGAPGSDVDDVGDTATSADIAVVRGFSKPFTPAEVFALYHSHATQQHRWLGSAFATLRLYGAAVTHVVLNDSYTDAGCEAWDRFDRNLTAYLEVLDPVDTSEPGFYDVMYRLPSELGDVSINRTVIVDDTVAPSISLVGSSIVTVEVYLNYTDPGVSVTDNEDFPVDVVIDGLQAVYTETGVFLISYVAIDRWNLTSQTINRTLVVTDTSPPIAQYDTGDNIAYVGSIFKDRAIFVDDDPSAVVVEKDWVPHNIDGVLLKHSDIGNVALTYTVSNDNTGLVSVIERNISVRTCENPLVFASTDVCQYMLTGHYTLIQEDGDDRWVVFSTDGTISANKNAINASAGMLLDVRNIDGDWRVALFDQSGTYSIRLNLPAESDVEVVSFLSLGSDDSGVYFVPQESEGLVSLGTADGSLYVRVAACTITSQGFIGPWETQYVSYLPANEETGSAGPFLLSNAHGWLSVDPSTGDFQLVQTPTATDTWMVVHFSGDKYIFKSEAREMSVLLETSGTPPTISMSTFDSDDPIPAGATWSIYTSIGSSYPYLFHSTYGGYLNVDHDGNVTDVQTNVIGPGTRFRLQPVRPEWIVLGDGVEIAGHGDPVPFTNTLRVDALVTALRFIRLSGHISVDSGSSITYYGLQSIWTNDLTLNDVTTMAIILANNEDDSMLFPTSAVDGGYRWSSSSGETAPAISSNLTEPCAFWLPAEASLSLYHAENYDRVVDGAGASVGNTGIIRVRVEAQVMLASPTPLPSVTPTVTPTVSVTVSTTPSPTISSTLTPTPSPTGIFQFTIDFEDYPAANLHGTDGWVAVDYGSSSKRAVVSTIGMLNGQGVRYTGVGGGVGVSGSRKSSPNFQFPDFNEYPHFRIEASIALLWWGATFGIGADMNGDGSYSKLDVAEIPVYVKIQGFNGPIIDVLVESGRRENTTDLSTLSTDWCRIRLEFDLTANSGNGSLTASFRDPQFDLIASPYQVLIPGVNGTSLNLAFGSGTVRDPLMWDGIYFHFEGSTGMLDDIVLTILP